MNVLIKSIITAATVLIMVSCEPDWGGVESVMIVEGWIESGGTPHVILSESISPSSEDVILEDYIISMAKVTVSTADTCVILTGGIDHHYFPPYIYTSAHLIGQIGERYTLDVYYEDKHITATTSIPEPCDLVSLEQYSDNEGASSGIEASFLVNESSSCRYQFFVKESGNSHRYLPSVMGFVDVNSINLLTTSVDSVSSVFQAGSICYRHKVYPGRNVLYGTHYNMLYESGDSVIVKLAAMDSVSASFWESYQSIATTSNMGLFSIIDNIKGNVEGANGYWCGYGVSKRSICLK